VASLIAVDVAILPPVAVAEAAMTISAALPPSESQGLRLDDTHLPHVTLTQQFIPTSAVPDATDAIARVLRGRHALPLMVTGPGRGSRAVWMHLALTDDLRELHRAVMDVMRPFEQRGGGPGAFAGGDARPGDVAWVSGFRRRSSYRRYAPHITLGHASALPAVEPIAFDATTVALCHLGRFCSCRSVLRSWSLAPVRKDDAR
jgi:2'-5' RNA ligase